MRRVLPLLWLLTAVALAKPPHDPDFSYSLQPPAELTVRQKGSANALTGVIQYRPGKALRKTVTVEVMVQQNFEPPMSNGRPMEYHPLLEPSPDKLLAQLRHNPRVRKLKSFSGQGGRAVSYEVPDSKSQPAGLVLYVYGRSAIYRVWCEFPLRDPDYHRAALEAARASFQADP